jgi:hypothetical protein
VSIARKLISIVVVLPAPLRPATPKISPAPTAKDTPRRMGCPP